MTILLHALAAFVLGNFTLSFLLKRTHVISFRKVLCPYPPYFGDGDRLTLIYNFV